MAFPKIPEARSEKVKIRNVSVEVQEWPFQAAIEAINFIAEATSIALGEAKKRGGIKSLQWRVPVVDQDGKPVLDANEEGKLVPKTEMNFDLILALVSASSGQLALKGDKLVSALNAALVDSPEVKSLSISTGNLLLGDVLTLLRAVLRVNFSQEGSLGKALAGLVPDSVLAPETSPNGSAPAPTPPPTSFPQPPISPASQA